MILPNEKDGTNKYENIFMDNVSGIQVTGTTITPLSLRDWFAGQALMGICANPDISDKIAETKAPAWARRKDYALGAYAQADAMLEAREAKEEK